MSILSVLTIKPVLYVAGLLALLCIGEGVALRVQSALHRAAITKVEADLDRWRNDAAVAKAKESELIEANDGWQITAEKLQIRLKEEQQQCVALAARNDKAIAAAKADAADADAALKSFVARYDAAVRKPDCASALHALTTSCPSLEGY
uniref:hypothetical protein n=1 Tax=Xanthomonas albilineans TaxID=29447 RepID=UPI0027DE6065|nr:hypothetical protein [Xanthomonas albilineans]